MVIKLDENEYQDEQLEMWIKESKKKHITCNGIVVVTIAISAILIGIALYFA